MFVVLGLIVGVFCETGAAAEGFRGQSFDIYSRPVKLSYGEVFQDLQAPIYLPDEVKEQFATSKMAITGYQADVVEMNEAGLALHSAPLYDCYLHHYGALLGKHDVLQQFYDKRSQQSTQPQRSVEISLEGSLLPRMHNIQHLLNQDAMMNYEGEETDSHHRPAAVGGGSGAEERGTPHQFPAPYAQIVEGADAFMPLMHLINSRGSSRDNGYSKLLECPCISERKFDAKTQTIDGKPPAIPFYCNSDLMLDGNTACSFDTYKNGFRCCDSGVFLAEKAERDQHNATSWFGMRFTFYYEPADSATIGIRPPESCCDVTGDLKHGGNIEYDVKACEPGEECIHKAVTYQYLDVPIGGSGFPNGGQKLSPEDIKEIDAGAEVDIIHAVGHQHVGAATPIGISLYKDATNELICHSKPRYGTGSEAGNEKGYIVGIEPCVFGEPGNPPPRMRRDTVVRVEAFYNTTYAHYGLMSLWLMNIADVKPTSHADLTITAPRDNRGRKNVAIS